MKFYGGSTAFYGAANAVSFYTGGGVSTLVPDIFTVSIDGHPYTIDLDQPFYRQYRRQLAPLIRTQADTANLPGEHTLDPNSLWRRSFEDWSSGASQRYLDRSTSVDTGFWQSKGIDALTTKWQISLLPEVASQKASANTNLEVLVCNGRVYVADGQTLSYTTSLSGSVTWTTVTGTPAVAISSICTDGYTVYAAYGASGIYSTPSNSSAATNYISAAIGSGAVIGYVNDRLMLGNNSDGTHGDGKLYNLTAGGASLGTALFTPNGTSVSWVGFASGDNQLYAALNVGGQALIYGTATTTDGTSLTAPTIQGQLPNGETVSAIYGYLGQLIIGTSSGVRYASLTAAGGINLGALITGTVTNSYGPTLPVQCLYGYGRWVWFGWTDYDGVSTGLGRIDLETFVDAGVLPAFCSDRMATTQGAVTGVAVINGVAVFCVSGQGVYVDDANLVSSGTIQSGYILYDLTDPKIAALVDIETVGPLKYGSYSVSVAVDNGSFNVAGQGSAGLTSPASFTVAGGIGERFEVQLTLNRDGTTTSQGPVITRWTLRAYPAPRRPVTWQLPLDFNERIIDNSMSSEGFDPLLELEFLEQLAANGNPVTYQEANQKYPVFVQDIQFLPNELTTDKHYYNGLCLVNIQAIPVPN